MKHWRSYGLNWDLPNQDPWLRLLWQKELQILEKNIVHVCQNLMKVSTPLKDLLVLILIWMTLASPEKISSTNFQTVVMMPIYLGKIPKLFVKEEELIWLWMICAEVTVTPKILIFVKHCISFEIMYINTSQITVLHRVITVFWNCLAAILWEKPSLVEGPYLHRRTKPFQRNCNHPNTSFFSYIGSCW